MGGGFGDGGGGESWGIPSEALDKSIKAAPTAKLSSKFVFHSSVGRGGACCVLWGALCAGGWVWEGGGIYPYFSLNNF